MFARNILERSKNLEYFPKKSNPYLQPYFTVFSAGNPQFYPFLTVSYKSVPVKRGKQPQQILDFCPKGQAVWK